MRAFVLEREETEAFLGQVMELVRFVAPRFVAEQKRRLVLAVGCTGGRHRSVALVDELARRLGGDPAIVISVAHRDLDVEEL